MNKFYESSKEIACNSLEHDYSYETVCNTKRIVNHSLHEMHFYGSSIKKENKFSVYCFLWKILLPAFTLWTLDASNTFCVFLSHLL